MEIQFTLEFVESLTRKIIIHVLESKWSSTFLYPPIGDRDIVDFIRIELDDEDGDDTYNFIQIMVSLGYCRRIKERFYHDHGNVTYYGLTEKAFRLLTKPSKPPNIFISYRRQDSSLLALLIQSRLMAQEADVFLDITNIDLGDEWHPRLHQKVSDTRYFICLIAPETISESKYVRQEIIWALEAQSEIIPIYHSGFSGTEAEIKIIQSTYPELQRFLNKNALIIRDINDPSEINSKIDQLLNTLGYAVI